MLRGMTELVATLSERHVSVIEKHVEDNTQDEKHVPDLLESIMRPTFFVKEELRIILFNMRQFCAKSATSPLKTSEFTISTFWIYGKLTDSRWRPTQQASPVSLSQKTVPSKTPKNVRKMLVLACQGPYPSPGPPQPLQQSKAL